MSELTAARLAAVTSGAAREAAEPALEKVGRGRSAEVYLGHDAGGRPIARKIFTGDLASTVVLYLLTGAPNPYTWCEPAIRSAWARRRILGHLVGYWFGDKVRLPRADSWCWNPEHRAYEIGAELIDGCHVPLRGPEEIHAAADPVRDLVDEVMKPLQRHLDESGFDGLVWQAGRGNPVASSNFMLEDPMMENSMLEDPMLEDGDSAAQNGQRRWVWIDLESGVPALFALNPLATAGFYLPKSLRHRGWLFDDVDVPKLRRYVDEHRADLESAIGASALAEISVETDDLERHQRQWKSIPRYRRSIGYELSQGRIDQAQAEHYRERPFAWYALTLPAGALRATRKLARKAWHGLAWLARFEVLPPVRAVWSFGTSQRYRARLARRLVAARIQAWADRRFLDRDMVERLHSQLRHDDVSSYVTDFGVHLAMKPFIKALQWFALPPMLALGWIDMAAVGFILIAGGLIGRVAYTAGRFAQAVVQRQRRPWMALGISCLPVVGNAAYPAELVYDSTGRSGEVARFILYDSMAQVGRSLPIWGGADSLTEHWFNRLGDVVVHLLAKPIR
ncbi:MAG: hypothetical protein GY719_05010 [bacterium]|nr:hypothetical protein [bacterium]